jgi:hypothetical protein
MCGEVDGRSGYDPAVGIDVHDGLAKGQDAGLAHIGTVSLLYEG